jgi:hypothetical protein
MNPTQPRIAPRKRPGEALNKYQIQENHFSEAKARVDYADFSGTAEAVPFQNRTYSEVPQCGESEIRSRMNSVILSERGPKRSSVWGW